MSRPKPDNETREQHILDAATRLILRQGYDKTTLGDVANEVGVSRGVVYLYFNGKESLFEALLYREVQKYNQDWLKILENSPDGGTIAGVFRAVQSAVDQSPFISALLKQDRRVFGNYLRKPGNLFESVQSNKLWIELLEELQAAGAIRADVQPPVFAYIMASLSLGLTIGEGVKSSGDEPSFEDLMNTVAIMLDRTLTPEDGGNTEAGRAIIRSLVERSQAQFEQAKKTNLS